MAEFNIVVPSEIPADETVLVIAVHFESGMAVEKEVPVFEIETSKTAYVLSAEESGILSHKLSVGDEVKSGQILGNVFNAQ
jgi:pyruvate/2-oxoglutarate dehydrogenase complex dihydrolipoamide acyltransferase (E2) component